MHLIDSIFSSKLLRERTTCNQVRSDELASLKCEKREPGSSRIIYCFGFASKSDWNRFSACPLLALTKAGTQRVDVIESPFTGEIYGGMFDDPEIQLLSDLLLFPGAGSPESVACGYGAAFFEVPSSLLHHDFFLVREEDWLKTELIYRKCDIIVSAEFSNWSEVQGFDRFLPANWRELLQLRERSIGRRWFQREPLSLLSDHECAYVRDAKTSGITSGTFLPCNLSTHSGAKELGVLEIRQQLSQRKYAATLHRLCLTSSEADLGSFEAFLANTKEQKRLFTGRML